MRTSKKNIPVYVILTLGALLILFPMYITLATTLKTSSESANSFFTLPKSLYLGNYQKVLEDSKLYYAYGNTLMVTLVSLIGEMIILPPMGFAVSRGMKDKKFFRGLYYFFLLGIFLPWQVRMMPVVKLMGWFNLLSPLGITLLYIAHATCESMFLYVGYLSTVSTSIEEAAYIDGASTFQIYSRVVLPLMKPILSTVLIREGLAIWNDFQLPLITLNRSYKMWTLTIYLNNYQSEYGVNYNEAFSCLIAFSICFTGERLNALTDSVEDGGADKCKICYNAVGCDCRISAKPKQQEIKYRGCNAGRHLSDECRDPKLARTKQPANRRACRYKAQGVFLRKKVCRADGNTDDRRKSGGKCRAWHAHPKRKHKQIIQKNIGKAAAQSCGHRECRIGVIADKGCKDVIQHETRCEYQKNSGVGGADRCNLVIGAHDSNDRFRTDGAAEDKNDTCRDCKKDGV